MESNAPSKETLASFCDPRLGWNPEDVTVAIAFEPLVPDPPKPQIVDLTNLRHQYAQAAVYMIARWMEEKGASPGDVLGFKLEELPKLIKNLSE